MCFCYLINVLLKKDYFPYTSLKFFFELFIFTQEYCIKKRRKKKSNFLKNIILYFSCLICNAFVIYITCISPRKFDVDYKFCLPPLLKFNIYSMSSIIQYHTSATNKQSPFHRLTEMQFSSFYILHCD